MDISGFLIVQQLEILCEDFMTLSLGSFMEVPKAGGSVYFGHISSIIEYHF